MTPSNLSPLAAASRQLVLHLARGADPAYVRMIVDLVEERMQAAPERSSLGVRGPSHDICDAACCPNLRDPARPAAAQS